MTLSQIIVSCLFVSLCLNVLCLYAEPAQSAAGMPTSPYTEHSAAAAEDAEQQGRSSGSGSSESSHAHLASAQLAGLKRRAALRMQRQRSAERSTLVGAPAFRMGIVGHPLADIDIMKCMREISSHLSWR